MTAVAMQQLFQELAVIGTSNRALALGLGHRYRMGEAVLGNAGARSRMHLRHGWSRCQCRTSACRPSRKWADYRFKAVYDALQEEASDLIEQAGLVRERAPYAQRNE